MAVREKDPVGEKTGAEPRAEGQNWLGRLDEFGQRHARMIVTVSAGLVILTVLIVANIVYTRTLAERLARDVAEASTVEKLRELKQQYASQPEVAIIIASLGNRLYDDGNYSAAKTEYDEFLQKFPQHPLADAVMRASKSLDENLKFENEEKDALRQIANLGAHPLKYVSLRYDLQKLKDQYALLKLDPTRAAEAEAVAREIERRLASPIGVGPIKEPDPVLLFRVKPKEGAARSFRVELFEDEAPNAVASLIELVGKKYFDGLKFSRINDERLQIEPKKEGAVDYQLAFERTSREADVGSLILMRKGENNLPGEFQLLLKSVEAPGEVTICGAISEFDREAARAVTAEDIIESVTVEKKRPHEYKATTLKP